MKFEFCGKLDCPDWILAQLFHASKLELKRFELICESVKDTILANGNLNEDLFDNLELDEEEFDIDDARACFGAVNYIMTNACIFQVTSRILRNELEQLGLSSEHTALLCEILNRNSDGLKMNIAEQQSQLSTTI